MKLLKKELRLALSPLTPFFLLFSFMTLIPGYPILVGSFFICLGIFYSFQSAREAGDILYTALLPIPKGDVVRGKLRLTLLFQLAGFGLMLLLTALRLTVLRGGVYAAVPMLPANGTYLAFALLIFLCFNVLFVGGFFRTAYALGRPFILFTVAAFLLVAVAEVLHHVPGLDFLAAVEGAGLLVQLPLLAAAALAYALGTALAGRRAVRRFEALDL